MSLFQNHKQKMQELRLKSQAEMRIAVMKMVVPLKIQACERLLLFLERSQLPVLVKRVFTPGVTKEAFHIALLQNVEDRGEKETLVPVGGNVNWYSHSGSKYGGSSKN